MANFMDYLKWRGDLSFSVSPFNEIDNLIFSQLCFVDFSNIVPDNMTSTISLHMAARKALSRMGPKTKKLGFMIPDTILELVRVLAICPRYRDILLCGYISETDSVKENQFAAVTAIISDDEAVITFRGTDDSLVGWKEDFNLCLFPNIPSQVMAAEYLESVSQSIPDKKLYICGHSKGGNLSIYSSVMSSDSTKARINGVYSDDGPGFKKEFFEKPEYLDIKGRIQAYVSQNSFIGLLFEQDPDTLRVIKSNNIGAFQHDLFSWQVLGTSLEGAVLTKETLNDKKVFNAWIEGLKLEDRKIAIQVFFDFLSTGGATTLTEAWENSPRLIKAYKELSEDKKKIVYMSLKVLFHERIKSIVEPISPILKSIKLIKIKKDNPNEKLRIDESITTSEEREN